MKNILFIFLTTLFLFLFPKISVCFAADKDQCEDQGITVKNLSFKDIWYKHQSNGCIILKRNYFFIIKPKEEIRLFSDNVCETPYCPACTYSDYKLYDADGDCRIKILPENTFSDM